MAESHSPPRSRNNDVPSYVTFFNRSDRTVNLFWINYEGKLVRYGRIPPFKGTSMNTYVTHPWIVRDADTGYPLLLNGKSVFHPSADTHEGSRMMIWIHIPVYSLLRRALEIIFIYFDADTVQKLDMPKSLKDLLKTLSPITNFDNYKFFNSMGYYDVQQLGFQADIDFDDDNDDDDDDDNDDVESDDDDLAVGVIQDNNDDDQDEDNDNNENNEVNDNDENDGSDSDSTSDDNDSDDDDNGDGSVNNAENVHGINNAENVHDVNNAENVLDVNNAENVHDGNNAENVHDGNDNVTENDDRNGDGAHSKSASCSLN